MEVTKFQVPTDSNTGRFRVLQTQSVDGWTPVNLRAELNDSGTGTWLIAPDHDEDGIPDCVTDAHKTQLDIAFEKLSLWKIVTDESEVVANVTNQESIQNSPVDLDPYPTYGAWVEWITGQFNPTPIQRNWWGGGNGNSGRLAGVNSAFNASKNGSVKQVFGGTSPYRMHSADFTWQSLPPDVTNFYSIIWGELSPGVTEYKELKPREYDTILTTLLGTASEFNAFLAIVGCQNRYCISGNFSDTASNFGKAWFYKKMAARTPTLTNVTYKRGSQIVNNGDSIVTCVGDAVNLTATAEYSVALSDQTVEFTVPVSLKFVSTPPAEHAYLNQPGQFISLEPGAYHITADLPTGDSTSTQISIISTKVDAITAVKTDIPSEAVPDSDILCKNQNQSLDLTATITPDISDAIADSLITWEVTPSAAGSFTDNTGKTAVWVQAPDFVSSFEDDVVITARCGSNIGTEFKLTIVSAVGSTIHVATSSDSQHLGTSPPDALVSLLPNVEVPKVQKFATDVDAYPLGGPDGWNLNIVSGGAGVTDITDVFDLVTVEHVVDNKLKFTVRTILDAPPGEYHVVDPTGHSEHVFVTKVELDVTNSALTLLEQNTLTATVTPSIVSATNYEFEIKRKGTSNWFSIVNGTSNIFTGKARVAGKFKLRVKATIGGSQCISDEKEIEVQFPSFEDIAGDTAVQVAMDTAWTETKNAATPPPNPTVREQGFYIRLNTLTEKYEMTATETGDPFPPTGDTIIDLGPVPLDIPLNPTPLDSPIYTVANFHTHVPLTFVDPGFIGDVGPSNFDKDHQGDMVGIVYDYIATHNSSGGIFPPLTHIRGGHDIDNPAKLYGFGPPGSVPPIRRSTP